MVLEELECDLNMFFSFCRYNVLFLLASGGKFNYIGSRKWLEEALDNTAYSNLHYSSSLLPLSKLTLCLDTLASKSTDKQGRLHMHVSKPPKEGSVAHKIYSNIKKVSFIIVKSQ